MLRQEFQELGVRRDARLRAMFGASQSAGGVRPAQCLRHAHATIQRRDQHTAECIAGGRRIDRHDCKRVLHDQLAIDTRTAAAIAESDDDAGNIDSLHALFDAALMTRDGRKLAFVDHQHIE